MAKQKNTEMHKPTEGVVPQENLPALTQSSGEQLDTAQEVSLQNHPATQDVVLVKTVPNVMRFFRAGLCFGPQPTELSLDGLSKGVLEQLQAEPNLVVILPTKK